MAIKIISKEELPDYNGRKKNYAENDIKEFMNSNADCCEIDCGDRRSDSIAAYYGAVARRMMAPIRVVRRGNRVFMIKKEDN